MDPIALEFGGLHILVDVTPQHLYLALEGELDLACAEIIEAVTRVRAEAVSGVTIDLGGLTFCDSTGLTALLDFHDQHVSANRDVRLVNAQPHLRRLAALLGRNQCLAA
jgi:anti-sigma B factor antagonist